MANVGALDQPEPHILGPGAGRCQALDQLFVEKRRLTTRFSQSNGGKGVVAAYGFSVAFGIVCRAINPALRVASDTHHHPGHQRPLELIVHSDMPLGRKTRWRECGERSARRSRLRRDCWRRCYRQLPYSTLALVIWFCRVVFVEVAD